MMEMRQPAISPRVSWGGVFAGFFTLLAVWALLGLLGLAVGLTATDPRRATGQEIGLGAGVWLVLSVLLASFFGGFVAARLAGVFWRRTGALHATVVWALGAVVLLALIGGGIAALANMWMPAGREITSAEMRAAMTSAWWMFGTLALSLVACLIGGAVGALEGTRSRGMLASPTDEVEEPVVPPVAPPLAPRET